MANSKTLKASVIIGGAISGGLRAALGTTQSGLRHIGEAIANVDRRSRLLASSIDTFARMGRNVDALRAEYAALAREADRLRSAQQRLAIAQARVDASIARRREIGGELRNAVGLMGAAAAGTFFPIRSAVDFETAMLGVAKQVEGARDASGNLTAVYFDMQRQIQALARDIPLATTELADMVTAGARMGVARDELIDFTRTAAMMADAFELPAGQLADDMGKIAGLFRIPIPRIGELADAINYLDDNAIATGGGIIDVLRRIGGMAQTARMSAKDSAALASTWLTMGSSAEVAGTASNALLRILGAATAQSRKVQAGFSAIGMTAREVQESMARDATGTILRVLDALNRLDHEQRLVATTRIFGAEYGDDIAKLASGVDEYRRQLALANGEAARGSMSREFQARLKTTAAQWQITKNRLQEVSVTIGSALLPAVNDLMRTVAPAVENVAEWGKQHPVLIRGIVGATLALTGLRVATLGARYAWELFKAPVLQGMVLLERFRTGRAMAQLGQLGSVAARTGAVMRGAFLGVGLATAPVLAVVGALAVGALVVRKYWQPLGAWFGGFFDGLRSTVGPAFAELGAALAPLKPIWDGVASAVSNVWDWLTRLLEPVKATNEQLANAAQAGRNFGRIVGAALAFPVRLLTSFVNLLPKVGSIAQRVAGWFGLARESEGGAARASAPMPGAASGRPAPAIVVAANPRGSAPVSSVTQQNTFHITQQPGESAEQLARRIAEHARRQEAIARRGSLADEAT